MLAAITEGGKKAYEVPEADMPGFINRSQHRAFVYLKKDWSGGISEWRVE